MPSALIIGGGVAGLSAAVELTRIGWRVALCEQRSFCGGRAYAFREPTTGDTVDNGQHLLMGCYAATFAYLHTIGAADGVATESRLQIPLVDGAGRRTSLQCPNWSAPWHLLAGLWRLPGFSKRALWRMIVGLRQLGTTDTYVQDDHLSIATWLDRLGQDARSREVFWHPLVLAVCNESPDRASVAPLLSVLREAFYQTRGATGLSFPRRSLSALFVAPAIAYLQQRGGVVRHATVVEAVVRERDVVAGVRLRDGKTLTADRYISALPPRALHRVMVAEGQPLPPAWDLLAQWEGVPILSVHCWFDRPVIDVPMLGLLGSRFHWAFDKTPSCRPLSPTGRGEPADGVAGGVRGNCIALVISAAREEAAWPRARVVTEAVEVLHRYLPATRQATLVHSQVTKELAATVSMAPQSAARRLPTRTPWPNFFLAGDWTQTYLPATIESAIRSGESAARAALQGIEGIEGIV